MKYANKHIGLFIYKLYVYIQYVYEILRIWVISLKLDKINISSCH